MPVRLGIVCAEFNPKITSRMLERAKVYAKKSNAKISKIISVPGSFDAPIAIQALLRREDVDAVVVLGAIIKGETKHDEVIAHALASAMVQLSLTHGKPVTLGVSGPGMTERQARARIDEYAKRSVEAAVALVSNLP